MYSLHKKRNFETSIYLALTSFDRYQGNSVKRQQPIMKKNLNLPANFIGGAMVYINTL
jgi:hypothetical protein